MKLQQSFPLQQSHHSCIPLPHKSASSKNTINIHNKNYRHKKINNLPAQSQHLCIHQKFSTLAPHSSVTSQHVVYFSFAWVASPDIPTRTAVNVFLTESQLQQADNTQSNALVWPQPSTTSSITITHPHGNHPTIRRSMRWIGSWT